MIKALKDKYRPEPAHLLGYLHLNLRGFNFGATTLSNLLRLEENDFLEHANFHEAYNLKVLLLAARKNKKIFNRLIKKVGLNGKLISGRTGMSGQLLTQGILHYAIDERERYRSHIKSTVFFSREAFLSIAGSRFAKIGLLDKLVINGADVNQTDELGWKPFILAAHLKDHEAFNYLIENKNAVITERDLKLLETFEPQSSLPLCFHVCSQVMLSLVVAGSCSYPLYIGIAMIATETGVAPAMLGGLLAFGSAYLLLCGVLYCLDEALRAIKKKKIFDETFYLPAVQKAEEQRAHIQTRRMSEQLFFPPPDSRNSEQDGNTISPSAPSLHQFDPLAGEASDVLKSRSSAS